MAYTCLPRSPVLILLAKCHITVLFLFHVYAKVGLARPMERVVRLDLAPRLETPPTFRLYVEIMASRSNVILVAVDQPSGMETIAACAYQVSPSKSVRPLSTGERTGNKQSKSNRK